jgi:hypothetical protein
MFFSNIGNQNIFLEKKHTPPSFKLNGRSLRLNMKENQHVTQENTKVAEQLFFHPKSTIRISMLTIANSIGKFAVIQVILEHS